MMCEGEPGSEVRHLGTLGVLWYCRHGGVLIAVDTEPMVCASPVNLFLHSLFSRLWARRPTSQRRHVPTPRRRHHYTCLADLVVHASPAPRVAIQFDRSRVSFADGELVSSSISDCRRTSKPIARRWPVTRPVQGEHASELLVASVHAPSPWRLTT